MFFSVPRVHFHHSDTHVGFSIHCRTKWIKTNGHEYKEGAGVILHVTDDLPVIGEINDTHVIGGNQVLFRVDIFPTSFEPHFRAYLLQAAVTEKLVYFTYLYQVLCIFECHRQ